MSAQRTIARPASVTGIGLHSGESCTLVAKPAPVDTGMVFVNHPTWTASDLPFGGIKNSGFGRELSSLGIQEFVNKKLIRVAAIDAPA